MIVLQYKLQGNSQTMSLAADPVHGLIAAAGSETVNVMDPRSGEMVLEVGGVCLTRSCTGSDQVYLVACFELLLRMSGWRCAWVVMCEPASREGKVRPGDSESARSALVDQNFVGVYM